MKILHTADLHLCGEHAQEGLKSLEVIKERVSKGDIDAVFIAGDIWDSAIVNSELSCFNLFVKAFKDIAEKSKVYAIYGTPSHDTDGSLEILKEVGIQIINGFTQATINGENLLVVGIPEPRRKNYIKKASGKKSTDEEVSKAIEKQLAQLKKEVEEAKKTSTKSYTVCMYHGDIAGAKYNEAQEVDSVLALRTSQLKTLKADYYALGHIHAPMQIENLPMYYSGSAYPKNFGETHEACFNVVDLDTKKVTIEKFGHVQNLKLTTKKYDKENIKGKKVWLEVEDGDADKLLKDLLDNGALQGSRVTICKKTVETTRAKEIAEKKSAVEKLEVYAKASNQEITESQKAKTLELEQLIERNTEKPCGNFELVKVTLRGAIGIFKGLQKDEISIDFREYQNGLIALSGDNGKGKTTLIENCHPYPQLLTRGGTLKEHFRLKDSFREIIYKNGKDYIKFLIQIDGESKTGSTKYYAFKSDDFLDWQPIAELDGNLQPYESFIKRTFGDLSLFLRTCFITQKPSKNIPDIAVATKGEKKELFAELAGITYLQVFSDKAKERLDATKHEAEKTKGKLEGLDSFIQENKQLEEKRIQAEKALNKQNEEKPKLESELKKLESDLSIFEYDEENNRKHEEKIAQLKDDIFQLELKIKNKNDKKTTLEALVKTEQETRRKVEKGNELATKIENEKRQEEITLKNNLEKSCKYQEALAVFSAEKDTSDKQLKEETKILQERQTELEILKEKKQVLYEKMGEPVGERCKECGQLLSNGKQQELFFKREELKKQYEAMNDHYTTLEKQVKKQQERVQEIQDKIYLLDFTAPIQGRQEKFDTTVLSELKNEYEALNVEDAKKTLNEIETSKKLLEEFESVITECNQELETKIKEKENEQALIKKLDTVAIAELRNKRNETQEKLNTVSEQKIRNEYFIESVASQLELLKEKIKEIEQCKKKNEELNKDIEDWAFLQKAFSKDGIQALELDALSPNVSSIANRILQSAYGERFKIDFKTTRTSGTGKNAKQIEDFIINVIDNKDGEEVSIENLSGGESVWIKRAIYDAFSVIRRQNCGFIMLDSFQDESDGALSSSAKTAYTRMLESAHKENGLVHTIIITHSEEVRAMIEQKINMEDL